MDAPKEVYPPKAPTKQEANFSKSNGRNEEIGFDLKREVSGPSGRRQDSQGVERRMVAMMSLELFSLGLPVMAMRMPSSRAVARSGTESVV